MLNNVINSIVYRSSYWRPYWKKFYFLEIGAPHSCQLRLILKPLIATRDFNNLFSKKWSPPGCNNMKKENSSLVLFKNLYRKIETPTFQNTFCWLRRKNNGAEELKCLLHTALISNSFFNENKYKRKRYSLTSVRCKETQR